MDLLGFKYSWTKIEVDILLSYFLNSPDKQRGDDQQYGQVDSDRRLKVDGLEEGGGVGQQQQEEGGEVGGQQVIHQASFEHYLHLQTHLWTWLK